ncbi:DUF456 family protein [Prolixibacter sp. SD074]|uniref:DUF456 family protein n=1 Tax=Prolixibacter sp. SD074 TaxID=2652391 RepID=UPI0035A30F5C
MLVGLIGCILPALPGPTLSYLGLVVLSFSDRVTFSTKFFVVWGVIALIVTVLDYLIPIWGTKGSIHNWGGFFRLRINLSHSEKEKFNIDNSSLSCTESFKFGIK